MGALRQGIQAEAEVTKDLNWSVISTSLFNLCFGGRARRQAICQGTGAGFRIASLHMCVLGAERWGMKQLSVQLKEGGGGGGGGAQPWRKHPRFG